MNYKRVLLFIGLVAAIIAAMPNTISLFGGDHTIPREVACDRCHESPEGGISALGVYQAYQGAESCVTCHRCNLTNYTEIRANGTGACTECHEIGSGCPRVGRLTQKKIGSV
jgi:hypothetical protein